SAAVATVVVAVDVLLPGVGSVVLLETFAVLDKVEPLASLALTLTTRVKVALAPAARVAAVVVTVPVPPTVGVVDVKPTGAVKDTKVVPVGTASVSATLCASLGPVLVRVRV